MISNGFRKTDGEPTLYIKAADGKVLIIVLYIDDLIFIGNDDFLIADFKEAMRSEFELINLVLFKYFFRHRSKKNA